MPSLQYPSERTCPPALLAELRRIEPTAELLYVGEGRWLLGTVRFRWDNYAKAARALAKIERDNATNLTAIVAHAEVGRDKATLRAAAYRQSRNMAYLRAVMQGFRPIADYTIQGEPDSRIVHDFARRDWLFRVAPDASDQEKLDEADGTAAARRKLEVLRDTLTLAKAGFRRAVRGLTQIVTHGFRERRLAV